MKSTTTDLLSFANTIVEALEDNTQIDVLYTYFFKAFDKVNHAILIAKLDSLGRNPLLSFFHSYLSERKQRVKVNSFKSVNIDVTSGEPKGVHLGPHILNLTI